MAELSEKKIVAGAFGGVELGSIGKEGNNGTNMNTNGGFGNSNVYGKVEAGTYPNLKNKNLPTKIGFWTRVKSFLFQEIDWNKEIKVELTPYQQKVEDEINEFLHQEITWEKVHDFLFKEVKFGKKNND